MVQHLVGSQEPVGSNPTATTDIAVFLRNNPRSGIEPWSTRQQMGRQNVIIRPRWGPQGNLRTVVALVEWVIHRYIQPRVFRDVVNP